MTQADNGEADSYPNGISDLINEVIQGLLEEHVVAEEEQLILDQDKERLEGVDFQADPLAYQQFAERIDYISDDFIRNLFDNIVGKKLVLSSMLIRGVGTDLWRFMYFIFTCLERLSVHRESFGIVKDTLSHFCEDLLKKEKFNLTNFFKELFLGKFVEAVKNAEHPQKREELILMLYSFFQSKDPSARHEAIRLYKEKLNDTGLLVQSLGVLINHESSLKKMEEEYKKKKEAEERRRKEEEERQKQEEGNKKRKEEPAKEAKAEEEDVVVWDTEATWKMLRDFKFYAKFAIKDKKACVRLHGLVLMYKLIELDYDWVQKVMIRYFDCVSPDDWWENRILVVSVYTALLDKLTKTELYQRHVKMKNADMTKMMSVENEMLVKVMKEVFDQITQAISKVLSKNLKPDIAKVALIHLVDVMAESRSLVGVFLDILLEADQALREWVLYSGQDEDGPEVFDRYLMETSTSVSHRCTLDNEQLKLCAGELLSELANKMKVLSPEDFGLNYLELLVFCFENADFQKLNVEVIDSLINHSLDHILNGMVTPALCEKSGQILERYVENYLREEVLIQDLEKRIGELIVACFNAEGGESEEEEVVKENMRRFILQLRSEYTPDKALFEKFTKMCTKVCLTANAKSISAPADAQFVEEQLGFELENDQPHSQNEEDV